MKKVLLLILLGIISYSTHSQNLTAFIDYRKYFMVFDNGSTIAIDHLPAQSFQIGGNCIPFVSNFGQFKVYHKGNISTLLEQAPSKYFATRNLLVYFLYDQLYVFDNGEVKMLSSSVKDYAIGDSLVAYYNENTKASYVYYNGKVTELERSLVGSPLSEFKAGDNIFAYFNANSKYFKIFYQGELHDVLQSNNQIYYEAGRNIVAFVDNATNSFHAYYKGEVIDLEDFQPKSFKVGDDMLAYVDNLGDFKVFSDGEIQTISSFEPDLYDVRDSLIVFSEQEYFKVFYNNKIYELENYVPSDFQMQESTIAFIGLNGWLKAFTRGRYITVTNDLISMFVVAYNMIYMNTTVNTIKIYYNGKLYNTN